MTFHHRDTEKAWEFIRQKTELEFLSDSVPL